MATAQGAGDGGLPRDLKGQQDFKHLQLQKGEESPEGLPMCLQKGTAGTGGRATPARRRALGSPALHAGRSRPCPLQGGRCHRPDPWEPSGKEAAPTEERGRRATPRDVPATSRALRSGTPRPHVCGTSSRRPGGPRGA